MTASARAQFERNSREFLSLRTRAEGEADAFLIREIFGHDIHAGVLIAALAAVLVLPVLAGRTRRIVC